MACVSCSRPLPDGARFCPFCGHEVVGAATEERRVVTVGFETDTYSEIVDGIADGELEGILYYNTYNSGIPAIGGSVMRVPLGGSFELVMGEDGNDASTKCTVCHSVSANGKVLVAGLGWSEEPIGQNPGNPIESASFDLSEDGQASQRNLDTTDGERFSVPQIQGASEMLRGRPRRVTGEQLLGSSRMLGDQVDVDVPT